MGGVNLDPVVAGGVGPHGGTDIGLFDLFDLRHTQSSRRFEVRGGRWKLVGLEGRGRPGSAGRVVLDLGGPTMVDLEEDHRAVLMDGIGYPPEPRDELVVPDGDLTCLGSHRDRRDACEKDEADSASRQGLIEGDDTILDMAVESDEVSVLGSLCDAIRQRDPTHFDGREEIAKC